ncbi:hypothetical protein [Sporosarcina ureae]|uniref:hypothetical protein n=1 Tax=Sporosarcina ureae TaxID=1571 RepID=UPI0026ECC3B0|nr:hypothetical protein [Sporosarcina ureae]
MRQSATMHYLKTTRLLVEQNAWQEMFPFWSLQLIESILLNLETIGYLDVMTGREGSTSKCYRINYAMCV